MILTLQINNYFSTTKAGYVFHLYKLVGHVLRMDARHPENRLRFFPTADPDSWVPRLDDPPTDSLWNVVQDSLNRGLPPPSQRHWAERAEQARLTQSTLNFTPQGAPQEEVNA